MSEIDIKPVIAAAEKGGRVIASYFGLALDIEEKQTLADVRTKADTEAEEAIIEELRKHYPDFSIYAEESGRTMTDSEYCFVIDPLDGSHNFTVGNPYFSVSIALLHRDETILGVVYNPITNKTFHAQKGQGAFADKVKIQTNDETHYGRATIAYAQGYHVSRESGPVYMTKLEDGKLKRLTTNWSIAHDLCALAEGRIESVVIREIEQYDLAAGKLIAQEAGAVITDFAGNPTTDEARTFVASNNKQLHIEVLKLVNEVGESDVK